jgi:UDP-glucose 4-epimerase
MKSIIVTGGAGYIGAHVVQLLCADPEQIVHVVDTFSQSRKNILSASNVVYHEVDIRNSESLTELFLKIKPSVVFHFAALASVPDSVANPGDYYGHNVIGTYNVLEAMRASGCKKIVSSSSAAVYGEPVTEVITEEHPKVPTSPYGQTKLMTEHMLQDYFRAYQISSISFRYFCAAGVEASLTLGEYHTPETHVIPSLIETVLGKRTCFYIFGDDFPTPDGTGIRDYIHVSDLADAHLLAMTKLEKEVLCTAYNLGINKGFSVKELLTAVENVAGKPVPHELKGRRPGDPARLIANSERAIKELRWQPKYLEIDDIIKTAYNSISKQSDS